MLALTTNAILDKITSYDIFKYYISNFSQVDKSFCSELRQDNNPTCVITKLNNDLYYKDFKFKGLDNCFVYVMKKYSVAFSEALEIINIDFNLNLVNPYKKINYKSLKQPTIHNFNISDIKSNEFTIIKVQIRKFNNFDKLYWNKKYNITGKELVERKIYALDSFTINDIYYKADFISYGYYFGKDENGIDLWKIYQPFSKIKWISNTSSSVFQGMDKIPLLGEQLIITKSYKDVLVLSKLGIIAVAPQSEVANIKSDIIENLKLRFKKIFIIYDNDSTGKRSALELSKLYDLDCIFLPEIFNIKDCSDFVEKKSYIELSNFLSLHGISCNNS